MSSYENYLIFSTSSGLQQITEFHGLSEAVIALVGALLALALLWRQRDWRPLLLAFGLLMLAAKHAGIWILAGARASDLPMELMRGANTLALALGWLQTTGYALLGIYAASQLRQPPQRNSPVAHPGPPRPVSAISTPD